MPGSAKEREIWSLDITDVALPDSYGVGRKDGFVYFVPGGAPGDRVRIRIIKEGKRFSFGEIIEIEEPSPLRREPPCPFFRACGGCTLQHISYPDQLRIKERHLRESLTRIGGIDLARSAFSTITPSPGEFFSRNKMEIAFGKEGKTITAGLREKVPPTGPYKGRVVPLTQCMAFSECVGRILPLFPELAGHMGYTPYNPVKRTGFLRHLVLRESKTTGSVMAILETSPGKMPDLKDFWLRLREAAPEVASFYRAVNRGNTDTGLYEKEEHLFGTPFIEESLEGLTFRIYPQSFFQPNTGTASLLFRRLVDLAGVGPDSRVLGLYCGMGPMEMLLAGKAREVTGVDSNPANIANARVNAKLNGIENCTFIEGLVEDVAGQLPSQPDLLVTDPPRGGISDKGLSLIAGIAPKRIAYVSCNPSTLARDLRYLRGHGYEPREIAPFDAFPETGHLETIVLLNHEGAL